MTTEKDKARVSDNELIAKFMEWMLIPEQRDDPNDDFTPSYWIGRSLWKGEVNIHYEILRFDKSWDWLMPVVEKINNMNHSVHIYPTRARFYKNNTEFIESIHPGYSLIEIVYCGVVQFIKWYNEQR